VLTEKEKNRATMALRNLLSKRILLFVGLGVTGLVLYFYFFVGPINIVDVLKRANLFYYVSAFLSFLVAICFSALAWQSLLSNLSLKTSLKRVFLFTWVGLFFDATVPEPGVTGDLSKAYMLAKRSNQAPGKIVASVVGHKIIGMFITVIDLVLGLTILAFHYVLPIAVLNFLGFVLFFAIFVLFIVVYFSMKPKATQKLLDWLIKIISVFRLKRWNPEVFRHNAEEWLGRFHEGIATLSAKRRELVRPVAFCFINWGFDLGVVFLVFASLGYPIPVDKVLIVYALTGTLQSIGVSVVGFTEVIMSTAYNVLSIPAALSLAVTLLTRFITLWFKLIVSYVAFQYAAVRMLLNRTPLQPQQK
jgi:uncharacterized protein (TIRG00374 family)